jgi:hypothetical protein
MREEIILWMFFEVTSSGRIMAIPLKCRFLKGKSARIAAGFPSPGVGVGSSYPVEGKSTIWAFVPYFV